MDNEYCCQEIQKTTKIGGYNYLQPDRAILFQKNLAKNMDGSYTDSHENYQTIQTYESGQMFSIT